MEDLCFTMNMSGDTCEETYLNAKERFKKKWFKSERKDMVKRIIDCTLNDAKTELYKTFGLE